MIKRLFFILTLLSVSASVAASNFVVSDIRLEGLQRVSASPVFAALNVQVGDSVDSEVIRQNIQSVFATGFFSNVQVARDDDVLIFIVQERPAIKSISIDGNKAIKTEQLTEVLSDNDLKEGEIFQEQRLQGISRELERSYISQARYGASVDAQVKELPNNMVEVEILVDEGKSAKIRHLNFVGNKQFSDKVLDDLFALTPAKWTTVFSSNDQYAKEKLTGDIENLESFYLDQGYLDFKVVSTQVSISPDRRSVYITINLDEGEVYKVSEVEIGGDPILPEATIRRLVLLNEGDTYSQALLDNTSEYIRTLLGNAGYSNADVKGLTEKDAEDNSVALTFFIDPGKRVYVRRISFKGNTKTSDDVMRREMRQMEAAPASNARIEQSKVRLERLAYFKGVNLETKDVPGTEDLIDVEYTVEEQPSGSITASVGYADFSGLNLGVNVQQANWLGTGKVVGFGVTRNLYQTNYSFSYNDPYFTPDGVSRGFTLFYRSIDTDVLTTIPYSTDTIGGQMNFGYPISEIARLGFAFGLENQVITTGENARVAQEIRQTPYLRGENLGYVLRSDYESSLGLSEEFQLETRAITSDMLAEGEPGFLDLYGNEFNNATVDLSWSRFTLNRGVLATRGSSQTLRFEATIPGSDMEYFKLHYEAQKFVPLNKSFTLRFKTALGYGTGYGKLDELPFFSNFYAGGFGSVRGFEQSSLGPQGSSAREYLAASTGWQDLNQNGQQDFGESLGSAYVLCDETTPSLNVGSCTEGKLVDNNVGLNNTRRNNAFGGNVLVEFSTELILPLPFVKDSRSMQLVAFVDAGNVFSTYCRETQLNCFNVDLNELSSSFGLGFTWLSGFGPMTFAYAKPIQQSEFDEREAFQFTFGAGF